MANPERAERHLTARICIPRGSGGGGHRGWRRALQRQVHAAPHVGGRILGANDRVVTASIGIRGQGNALKRGFAKLKNVEIKTLCDIDANLAPERINDARL